MANRIVRGTSPPLTIVIEARTAKKTLLRVISASESHGYDGLLTVDPEGPLPSRLQGPVIVGPRCVDAAKAPPVGATAGYFQTSPEIKVEGVIRDSSGNPILESEVINRVTASLRIAEGWGWSRVLTRVRRITVNGLVWERVLRLLGASAMAPPASVWWANFLLTPGPITVLLRNFVAGEWAERDRAWLIVHEALHHSLYSVAPLPANFRNPLWDFNQSQHHIGISLASIGNSAILNSGPSDPAISDLDTLAWPSPWYALWYALYPLSPTRRSASTAPDLRAKSAIQPVPTGFGTRLDAMSSIISDWGLGGWADRYCPNLNYTTSGVPSPPQHLVLDLNKSDNELGWSIVGRTVDDTAAAWAWRRKIAFTSDSIRNAANMALLTIMARLGIIP